MVVYRTKVSIVWAQDRSEYLAGLLFFLPPSAMVFNDFGRNFASSASRICILETRRCIENPLKSLRRVAKKRESLRGLPGSPGPWQGSLFAAGSQRRHFCASSRVWSPRRCVFKNEENARTIRPKSSRASGGRAQRPEMQFVLCFTIENWPPAQKP